VCFEDQYAVDTRRDQFDELGESSLFQSTQSHQRDGCPRCSCSGRRRLPRAIGLRCCRRPAPTDAVHPLVQRQGRRRARRHVRLALLDALTGVGNYYNRADQGTKVPVLYPGFNAAYANGAPGWSIAYDLNGGDTLAATYNLSKGVATWCRSPPGTTTPKVR